MSGSFKVTAETQLPYFNIFGIVMWCLSLYIVIKIVRDKDVNMYAIASWYLIFFIPAAIMNRFLMNLIIPQILLISWYCSINYRRYKMFWYIVPIFCLIVFVQATNTQWYPHNNDVIHESMVWLKDNTDEDIKIYSWWDYGVIYEATSRRGSLYRSSEPKGLRGKKVVYSLFGDSDINLHNHMPDDAVFIAYSEDIKKHDFALESHGIDPIPKNKSNIYKALNDGLDKTLFQKMYCGSGKFDTELCIWRKIVK